MDFKRKAYDRLTEWKMRIGHKPLIVEGLRQVGKSYIVAKFAEENYENSILLDFRHRKELRLCFQENLNVDQIIALLRPYLPEKNFVPVPCKRSSSGIIGPISEGSWTKKGTRRSITTCKRN